MHIFSVCKISKLKMMFIKCSINLFTYNIILNGLEVLFIFFLQNIFNIFMKEKQTTLLFLLMFIELKFLSFLFFFFFFLVVVFKATSLKSERF